MTITFGAFTFDGAAREVRCGGESVHLSPKAFDLLALLVRQAPNAVSKADIHGELWPNTFVSDGNLAVLIAEIRRALGDSARQPAFVRTVSRFGYAFGGGTAPAPGSGTASPASGLTCHLTWGRDQFRLHAGDNILGRDVGADISIDAVGGRGGTPRSRWPMPLSRFGTMSKFAWGPWYCTFGAQPWRRSRKIQGSISAIWRQHDLHSQTHAGTRIERAHGIERRLPYLDESVISAASESPVAMKVHGGVEKVILREADKPIVPESVYQRKTHGCVGQPAAGTAVNKFDQLVQDTLRGSLMKDVPFFSQRRVIDCLDKCGQGQEIDRAVFGIITTMALSVCAR